MFPGDHVTLEESVVKVMSVGWGEHYIFGEPMGAGVNMGAWLCAGGSAATGECLEVTMKALCSPSPQL